MDTTIRYLDSADELRAEHLTGGFFAGWPQPPDAETHLRLLRQSDRVVLAFDERSDRVVGFATALTDGVLSAFIPLLEVLPPWRGRGVGTALIRQLVASLEPLYAIDVVCDPISSPSMSVPGPSARPRRWSVVTTNASRVRRT